MVSSGDEETAVNGKLLRKRTKGRGRCSQSAVPYTFSDYTLKSPNCCSCRM